MKLKEKLESIVYWLNENYNQDSENYSIFNGAKPEVIRYNKEIAISLWACGAIVCIDSLLYFISEDDGNWFIRDSEGDYGLQSTFSIGWAESFTEAIKRLENYINKNGKPVYFSGTNTICHYTL